MAQVSMRKKRADNIVWVSLSKAVPSIHGVYKGMTQGKYSPLVMLQNGEKTLLMGTNAILRDLLSMVGEGEEITIMLLGTAKSRTGKEYFEYDVMVESPELPGKEGGG